jgi:hypothetical protein
VGIKTARNDWYQSLEMLAVCAAVRERTQGFRRIGYGGSMGGYAAINFAEDLELAEIIAVCPQFSIDPARVPFEHRWLAEARTTSFCIDKIAPIAGDLPDSPPPYRARGWLIHDPLTIDRHHADLIRAHHDLVPVPVYYGGHDQMLMLQQSGVFSDLLLDMVHGRFAMDRSMAALRTQRRNSAIFWLNFATALAAHGRHTAAERALARARTCPINDTNLFHWRYKDAMTACLAAAVHGPAYRQAGPKLVITEPSAI